MRKAIVFTADGHGLIITGVGVAHATASVMALGLHPHLDLTRTTILIAGIGGANPNMLSLGSAAWAERKEPTASNNGRSGKKGFRHCPTFSIRSTCPFSFLMVV